MIKDRVEKIQSNLGAGEALLVRSIPNRFYLTGFESSDGEVFITREYACFLIDFRYVEKAKSVVDSMDVVLSARSVSEVSELCKKHAVSTLYVETESMSMAYSKLLGDALEGTEISQSGKFDALIEEMRSIKTADELLAIKKAQKLTDETFSYILNNIKPGRTEREVMLDMEFYMRRLGSEGVSFDFIVVSGKNSSLPHGVPTDKVIENGDFLTMDFGAIVDGYHSDMTRTVAVGDITDEQKFVYDTVLKAQTESIAAIREGVICKDIDKVARDIIYSAGFEGCFGHGLGHSVGVEIHENPNFNTRCDKILKAGTIMTVEPGIYLENKYGVRIEDMIFATADGCENLTHSPKHLIVL